MAVSMKEKIKAKLPGPITFETNRLLCEGRIDAVTGVIFRRSSDGCFVGEDGR
jgi:hypothetical protein